MGLFGGKSGNQKPMAQQQPPLTSIRLQKSAYGSVRKILYGRNRISGDLIDTIDFTAVPHVTQQASTGGKKGGGAASQGQTTYTYTAAMAIGLCEGPINSIGTIWDSSGKIAQETITEQFTVPIGGGSIVVSQAANFNTDIGVDFQDIEPVTVNDVGDPLGSRTINVTQRRPIHRNPGTGTPPAGTYGGTTSPGVYTFNTADAGKTVNITYRFTNPASPTGGGSAVGNGLNNISLTLFPGQRPGGAWSYMTSKHPERALTYYGLAYVATPTMDLGSQGSPPNLSYEVFGLLPFGGAIPDANPAAIIFDLVTNTEYGLGIDSGFIADMTAYSNYCISNSLFVSPILDSQTTAADLINHLLQATNSTMVWSNGQMKFIPYGERTTAGNGAVYTPNNAPIYDLTDDDFIGGGANNGNKLPVRVTRPDLADAYNSVQIEFLNAANDYNPEIVEESDLATVALYGIRKQAPTQMHFITNQAMAAQVGNFMLKRNLYIRATYEFDVSWIYSLLEPMDIVTLTDSTLGLSKTPVRITSVKENSDGTITIQAEEFPFGVATPTLYPKQATASFVPQNQQDPGNINQPIFFEGNNRLSGQNGYELWMGVSGVGQFWGGATVHKGYDGSTYQKIGVTQGKCTTGVTASTITAISGLDLTNSLQVDLTESAGTLTSVSTADADAFRTLLWVDGEIISYATATPTAPNKYTLTYLRRGVFGSPVSAHTSGTSKVVLLNTNMFIYDFTPEDIGKTLHFKFTSFNLNGLGEQNIANVTDYQFTVAGSFKGAIDLNAGVLLTGTPNNSVGNIDTATGNANNNLTTTGLKPGALIGSSPALTVGNSQQSVFLEAFEQPIHGTWNLRAGTTATISYPSDGFTGGKALNTGVNFVWLAFPQNLPYDSTKMYRVKARARKTAGANNQLLWLGVEGVAADGISLLNETGANSSSSQHYVVNGFNVPPDGLWRDFVGYINGFGAPNSNGLGGSVSSPLTMYSGVKYFRPLFILNYPSGGDVYEIDYVSVDIMPENLDQVADSATYGRVVNGALTSGAVDPTKSGVIKKGSTPPSILGNPFTYAQVGTTGITWSWNVNILRSDGTSVNTVGSQAITGLSSGVTYRFFPYYDESLGSVQFANASANAGSPAIAYAGIVASQIVAAVNQCYFQTHTPLTNGGFDATTATPSSPPGGGGGGGGGTCFKAGTKVMARVHGLEMAMMMEDLCVGDFVLSKDGWVEVTELEVTDNWNWIRITFQNGESLTTTPGHPYEVFEEDRIFRADEMSMTTAVETESGISYPAKIEAFRELGKKVKITVTGRHMLFAGDNDPVIHAHNAFVLPS